MIICALSSNGRSQIKPGSSDSDKVIIGKIGSSTLSIISGLEEFKKALESLESQNESADLSSGKLFSSATNTDKFVAEFPVLIKKTKRTGEYAKLVVQKISGSNFFVFFAGKSTKPVANTSSMIKRTVDPKAGGVTNSTGSAMKEIPPHDDCPETYGNWEGIVGEPCKLIWLSHMYCPPITIYKFWGQLVKAQFIYQKRTVTNCHGIVTRTFYRWAHYDCSCK